MKLHWMEKASFIPLAIWLLMVALDMTPFLVFTILLVAAFGFLLLRGQHIRHAEELKRWSR